MVLNLKAFYYQFESQLISKQKKISLKNQHLLKYKYA